MSKASFKAINGKVELLYFQLFYHIKNRNAIGKGKKSGKKFVGQKIEMHIFQYFQRF